MLRTLLLVAALARARSLCQHETDAITGEKTGQCTGTCACGSCYVSKHGTCGCSGAMECEMISYGDCSCGSCTASGKTCQKKPVGGGCTCSSGPPVPPKNVTVTWSEAWATAGFSVGPACNANGTLSLQPGGVVVPAVTCRVSSPPQEACSLTLTCDVSAMGFVTATRELTGSPGCTQTIKRGIAVRSGCSMSDAGQPNLGQCCLSP
jgi:hypothetical protein